MSIKNCAFQYAKIGVGLIRSSNIVCDENELTFEEAQALWDKHYEDCAKWIKAGNEAEMVIWIEMETPQSYGKHAQYISTDAESDGVRIWETKRNYFTKYQK